MKKRKKFGTRVLEKKELSALGYGYMDAYSDMLSIHRALTHIRGGAEVRASLLAEGTPRVRQALEIWDEIAVNERLEVGPISQLALSPMDVLGYFVASLGLVYKNQQIALESLRLEIRIGRPKNPQVVAAVGTSKPEDPTSVEVLSDLVKRQQEQDPAAKKIDILREHAKQYLVREKGVAHSSVAKVESLALAFDKKIRRHRKGLQEPDTN